MNTRHTTPRPNGAHLSENGGDDSAAPRPDKQALSPTEFASLFGRHRSWSYRLLYAGLIQKLDLPGRILISRREADRLLSSKANHGEVK